MIEVGVGIDTGKQTHVVELKGHTSVARPERLSIGNTKADVARLVERLESYIGLLRKDTEVSRVKLWAAMESTGIYHLPLLEALRGFYEVFLYNTLQTRGQERLSIRKCHTDEKAASNLARLPLSVDAPMTAYDDELQIALRELVRYRYALVDLRSCLRQRFERAVYLLYPQFHAMFSDIAGKTAKALLRAAPNPDLLRQKTEDELAGLLKEASHGYYDEEHAKRLLEMAENTLTTRVLALPCEFEVYQLLDLIEYLDAKIADVERECSILWARVEHKFYYPSIPGLTRWTALGIYAELGNPRKYKTGDAMVAFVGLDLEVYESGETQRKTMRMTKRGSPIGRRVIWEAAEAARRTNPEVKAIFARKREEKKHYDICIHACTKKLLRLIYAVEKKQQRYQYYQ